VAVAVGVAVAVTVAVAVAVTVAVVVIDAVDVAVAVDVRVAVAVDVGEADGVGRSDPFADPVSLTFADAEPAVALLLIAILAEKLVPLLMGANTTLTVNVPCAAIIVVPCPDVILKNGLPAGGATVTESARPPLSVIVNDFV